MAQQVGPCCLPEACRKHGFYGLQLVHGGARRLFHGPKVTPTHQSPIPNPQFPPPPIPSPLLPAPTPIPEPPPPRPHLYSPCPPSAHPRPPSPPSPAPHPHFRTFFDGPKVTYPPIPPISPSHPSQHPHTPTPPPRGHQLGPGVDGSPQDLQNARTRSTAYSCWRLCGNSDAGQKFMSRMMEPTETFSLYPRACQRCTVSRCLALTVASSVGEIWKLSMLNQGMCAPADGCELPGNYSDSGPAQPLQTVVDISKEIRVDLPAS